MHPNETCTNVSWLYSPSKRAIALQHLRYSFHLPRGIFPRLCQISPHGRRPARIVFTAADDVEMKLRHDVTDGGEIDFLVTEAALNEARNRCGFVYRGVSQAVGQIQQIRNLGLRHEDKPRQNRISMQQNVAQVKFAEAVTIGQKLRVNDEIHRSATWHPRRSESRCRLSDGSGLRTCGGSP